MSVDMTKWQEIAKANIHNRPTGEGRLAGKITIVTGAAQGFGKGIAEELYKEGATIVIADMNQPLAEQVAAEMGERACAIAVNVSDEESVANLVAQTVEKFGGLDLMVANAGVVRSGPLATFEKKDPPPTPPGGSCVSVRVLPPSRPPPPAGRQASRRSPCPLPSALGGGGWGEGCPGARARAGGPPHPRWLGERGRGRSGGAGPVRGGV